MGMSGERVVIHLLGLLEGRSPVASISEMKQATPADKRQYGFGRILVVPGVHACYGKEDAQMRGWVEFPQPAKGFSEMVNWQDK